MLNANAKAFVPGGSSQGVTPGTQSSTVLVTNEVSLFRYILSSPPLHTPLLDEQPQSLSVLQKLMSKRQLQSASKGGAGFAAAHQFVAEFCSTLSNNPNGASGFVLSRELLSLSAVEAIQEASQRDGFLFHLGDVPANLGADVGNAVAGLWEPLMTQFGQDFRVTMLGYFFIQIQNGSGDSEQAPDDCRFLHYFFVCTTPKKNQLVQLGISSFGSVANKCISEVSTIVPRIFSPALSCAVVVNLTDSSPETKSSCTVELCGDSAKTLDQLGETFHQIERFVLSKQSHDQSEVIVVNLQNVIKSNFYHVPLADVILIICQFCDRVMGAVVGITASPQQWSQPFLSRGLLDSWRFDPSTPLAEIVEARRVVFPRSTRLGCGIFSSPLSLHQYQTFGSDIPSEFRSYPADGPLLTRKALAANIDCIAKEQFKIRRQSSGVPVVVAVDRQGKIFCIDAVFGHVVAVPSICWSNALAAPHDSIFQGSLVASFRGDRQFRIIVHDVAKFNGVDVRESPFTQRWAVLDALGLDDETCWPHSSPNSVVIIRSLYASQLSQCEQLLNDSSIDSPSCGLQFVCISKKFGDCSQNFRWIPTESLVARFVVDELESLGASDGQQVKRAYLSCRESDTSNETFKMFKDEYCDFHSHTAPDLIEGCIIECSLRRAPTASSNEPNHWWELLNTYLPTDLTASVDSFAGVDDMVSSPTLTLEELRWLAKINSYLCGRCQKVNDIGKASPTLKSYQCRPCWEATGHGDCINCNATYATGSLDGVSNRFYCDNCWNTFTTPKAPQPWAPPPPPDATFSKIVSTRVISLFIDRAAAKGSNGDVLELCCGGSVVRKWLNAGVGAYVGVDNTDTAVEETFATIKQHQSASPSSPTTSKQLRMHEVICGDAFDPQTWVSQIAQVHPTQFHTVTCFSGLHHAFSSEKRARDALFAISNALVPNGLFLGSLWSANALLRKGAEYENSAFRCTWDENPSPRIGSTFTLELLDGVSEATTSCEPLEEPSHHVVPLDFLVAVAGEFKLELMREYTFTYADLLSDDDRWTRPLSADEKELLAMRMTFGFRKLYQRDLQAK